MSGMSNSDPRARLIRTARPLLGAGPLADDGADDREGHADAQPAEDVGQGGRDLERGQDLAVGRRAGCRPSSSSRASTERMPTIVAMATGKKTISAQMTTLPASPGPNHRTSSGARTRIGIGLGRDEVGRGEPLDQVAPGQPVAGEQPEPGTDDEAEGDLDQRRREVRPMVPSSQAPTNRRRRSRAAAG